MPRVSVVMPAYNAEKYIAEAIESILGQTFFDFEFIIINDGSRDKTENIIKSYHDSRIIYLENQKNCGIVATLNRGIEYASGEYIARMDADDIAVAERFQKQVGYMDVHQEVVVLGTAMQMFGDGIADQKRVFTADPLQLKAELIFNPCIAHPTAMIRRNVLLNHDLRYDINFSGAEDYHLWWRISRFGDIAALPDILHKYRLHDNQITQKKDDLYRQIMSNLLDLRFKDIGFAPSKEEKQFFLNYCLGEFDAFTIESLKCFIDTLKKLLELNKLTGYFDPKRLNRIFELAIVFSLNNSSLSKFDQSICYKYAKGKQLFTLSTRAKFLCNGYLWRRGDYGFIREGKKCRHKVGRLQTKGDFEKKT